MKKYNFEINEPIHKMATLIYQNKLKKLLKNDSYYNN